MKYTTMTSDEDSNAYNTICNLDIYTVGRMPKSFK